MNPENLCPVCGYEMEAPPKNYRVCPSCGTEFGVHDANASVADLRDAWLKSGPRWWSNSDSQPTGWDPLAQMERAGIVVKRQPASQPSSIGTSSSTAVVGGRDYWVATGPRQPDGISREVEPH